MPSEAAKKRQAKKKAAAQSRGKPKPAAETTENGVDHSNTTENGASVKLDLSNRSCTGVLASHPQSRDVKIENFSITFHGVELLTDTKLELNCGRRYGLLGLNGCGKFCHSTFEFTILLQIFPVFSKQLFCISVPLFPLSPYVLFEFF